MPWVILDDGFNDHPKWASAPTDSIAMWVAALAWCNHNERWDGRIPTIRLAGLVNAKNPKRTIADLEQRRAVHRDGDHHVIHNFAEWQRVERKKAISEVRRANGRKGAAVRWAGHGDDGNSHSNSYSNGHSKRDGLPPTTDHLVQVSDNSTHENTPQGVDNSDRRNAALDLYAAHQLDVAKGKGTRITSEARYTATARRTGEASPDLDRWLAMFPDAPASAVAAWLAGDKHSMAYYERHDDGPLADVHPLRRDPA